MNDEEFQKAVEAARDNAQRIAEGKLEELVPVKDECRIYFVPRAEYEKMKENHNCKTKRERDQALVFLQELTDLLSEVIDDTLLLNLIENFYPNIEEKILEIEEFIKKTKER